MRISAGINEFVLNMATPTPGLRAAWPAVMARVACSGENAIGVMANNRFCAAQT